MPEFGLINNGDSGLTVRTILNDVIDYINSGVMSGITIDTLTATTIDLCANNGTLKTDSISGCSPINFYSEGNFTDGLSANTITTEQFSAYTEVIYTLPLTYIGTNNTGSNPSNIFVKGNYAYVLNYGTPSLEIFDISNPSLPTSVGSVATDNGPRGVFVKDNYAYVVNYDVDTFQVIDVSNPSSPVVSGSTSTYVNPYNVYVEGNYAYVVNPSSDILQVIDITDPTTPTEVGFVSTNSSPFDVKVQGNYAYVVGASNTFQVFDITNPTSPTEIADIATESYTIGLSIQGNYAYVTNFSQPSLQVIDISNPSSPSVVTSLLTSSQPIGVFAKGNYVIVACNGSDTIEIYDITNPLSPSFFGSVPTDNEPYYPFVQGNYIYVVNYLGDTLQVFDFTPTPKQHFDTSADTKLQNTYAPVIFQGTNQAYDSAGVYDVINDWTDFLILGDVTPYFDTINGVWIYDVTGGTLYQNTEIVPINVVFGGIVTTVTFAGNINDNINSYLYTPILGGIGTEVIPTIYGDTIVSTNEILNGAIVNKSENIITSGYSQSFVQPTQSGIMTLNDPLGMNITSGVDTSPNLSRVITTDGQFANAVNVTDTYIEIICNNGLSFNLIQLDATYITLPNVPAYDDDADAGANGVPTNSVYKTTGNGANPLDVPGILMIKQ